MRIAILNWRDLSSPLAGGAEVVAHRQASGLARRGHQVTFLTSSYSHARSHELVDSYEVIRLGGRFSVYWHVRKYLIRASERKEFDVVLEHVNGVPWFSPMWVSTPVAVFLYHVVSRGFFETLPFPLAFMGYVSERVSPLIYSGVPAFCLGESARDQFVRLGFNSESISLAAPGIDINQYGPSSGKAVSPTILMVGPLKRYKRHDLAIRAMATVLEVRPDAALIIIGEDRENLVPKLTQLAKELGVQHAISFPGFVSEADKVDLLQKSWCVTYASIREGWGLGVLEAAACGTPAVVSRSAGLVDSIEEGVTGLSFEPGNAADLAAQLLRLMADRDLRDSMSHQATLSASGQSWTKHVDWVEKVLVSLAAETGKAQACSE